MTDDDKHDLARPLGYRYIRQRLGQPNAVPISAVDGQGCTPHHVRAMHRRQSERAGWSQQEVVAQGAIDFAPPQAGFNRFEDETDYGPAPIILAEQIISPRSTVPNLEIDGIY